MIYAGLGKIGFWCCFNCVCDLGFAFISLDWFVCFKVYVLFSLSVCYCFVLLNAHGICVFDILVVVDDCLVIVCCICDCYACVLVAALVFPVVVFGCLKFVGLLVYWCCVD